MAAQEGVVHPQSHCRTEVLLPAQGGSLSPHKSVMSRIWEQAQPPRQQFCTPAHLPTIRHCPSFLSQFATNFLWGLGQLSLSGPDVKDEVLGSLTSDGPGLSPGLTVGPHLSELRSASTPSQSCRCCGMSCPSSHLDWTLAPTRCGLWMGGAPESSPCPGARFTEAEGPEWGLSPEA